MENKPHTSFGPPKGGLEREIIYFRDTKVGEILEFGLMSYHFKHIWLSPSLCTIPMDPSTSEEDTNCPQIVP